MGEQMKLMDRIAAAVAAAALAVTLVAAGLAACCLPQTTQVLAEAFSGTEDTATPFSHAQLVRAAVATRDYTVGSHDRAAVMGVVAAVNRDADTAFADADEAALETAPDVYTLDAEALSHLDDVYGVVSTSFVALGVIALVALAGCVFLGARCGRRALGGVLALAGAAVVVVFALLAAWVCVDFNGFFAAFHSLFFADGSWTFSYDSLLITMYPPAFWMGMGAVWLAVTGVLSILAIIVGGFLRRSGREHSVPKRS